MKVLWLDAHLDPEVAPWIGNRFRMIVKHLIEVGLDEADDSTLFAAAGRLRVDVIVTKDRD